MQKPANKRSSLDDGVVHLVHRVAQRAEEILTQEMGEADLTARQLAVLISVAESDDPSQTDLVEVTGVDRSTLADLVKRLVRKGLLQRRRSRQDARAYIVGLSDAGRAALKSARPKAVRADTTLLKRLSAEQRKALIEALQIVGADE